jgi:glycine betaine/proline transport system substrate-binding protein
MKRMFASAAVIAIAASAHPALAEDASCAKVRSADMGWTDIAITTNTAAVLLKALGYEMENTLLGLTVAYESLKNKDVDVFLGNWRPAQDTEFKAYFDNKWVEVVGLNLDGAKYTLAVPKYVADAGVRSFDDLAKHADKFDRKIYGIEPGSNLPLTDMVKAGAHGLAGWEVVESSEQAMLTQVQKAIPKQEWIAFLGWQPHPMNIDIAMEYLSGGDTEFGPNFGGATVYTLARPGWAAQCPNAARFFKNLVFDVAYENQAMRLVTADGKSADVAATDMMKAHPEKLAGWLDGVTTLDGKPGLEAVKAALGLP